MNSRNVLHNTIIKEWHKIVFLLVVFTGLIQSCKEDDSTEQEESKYLVQYEKITSITSQNVAVSFSLLMLLYPEISQLDLQTTYGVDVYRVKYKTALNGEDITASGLICIPQRNDSFPVLSFQNGTNTAHASAPSVNYTDEQFTLLLNASGLGYIVVIPDYIGFGESTQVLHPYYHRESSDASVIDLIHACTEMLDLASVEANTNGKLFLMGYSQGGWATMSALKTLEEDNTTGLEPVASSCGAGAYNLMGVATHILQQQTYESPVYLPYFIESHRRNGFLDVSLDVYFNQPYANTIPGLFDGQHSLGNINSSLTDSISKLVTPGMLTNLAAGSEFESLRQELTNNSIEAWPIKGKLLLFHGKADKTVPTSESENMYNSFLEKGSEANVLLVLADGIGHSSGVIPWGVKSIVWINSLK